MGDPKCARMMLDSAARDASALDAMRDPLRVSEEVFGFHFQQAAEKAFKAWIATRGGIYALTHDLGELLEQLAACGAPAEDLDRFQDLVAYTPYAVEFRYQGVDESVESIDRDAAIVLVAELLDHVRAELAGIEGTKPPA